MQRPCIFSALQAVWSLLQLSPPPESSLMHVKKSEPGCIPVTRVFSNFHMLRNTHLHLVLFQPFTNVKIRLGSQATLTQAAPRHFHCSQLLPVCQLYAHTIVMLVSEQPRLVRGVECHPPRYLTGLFQKVRTSQGLGMFPKPEACRGSVPNLCLQGYTLADEEEDPLIYQHRMLRGGQGDALASGPVETGPMKKLHVSTINLQKAGPLSPGGPGESPGGPGGGARLFPCSAPATVGLERPQASPGFLLKV